MLQIKRDVGGLVRVGQLGQESARYIQGQLCVDRVVIALRFLRSDPNAGHLAHKNQLVRLQGRGHRGGHLFHGEVERLARWRKTKGG